VFAPRGLAHAWRCVSPGGGKALLAITPGDNFEAFAGEMARAGIIPSDPAAIARLAAIAERYGIEMLPIK
jgi:hypothetical protein